MPDQITEEQRLERLMKLEIGVSIPFALGWIAVVIALFMNAPEGVTTAVLIVVAVLSIMRQWLMVKVDRAKRSLKENATPMGQAEHV